MIEKIPTNMDCSKEGPSVLYHASHNAELTLLSPRAERTRDTEEGPKVFATPNKAFATAFLIEGQNDDWTIISMVEGTPLVIIRADRDEFVRNDRGGTMYELPADSFTYDPTKGMRENEWTSAEAVSPVGKDQEPSALDAMIREGVQVYFVDDATYKQLWDAPTLDILRTLESENQRRCEHVVDVVALAERKG